VEPSPDATAGRRAADVATAGKQKRPLHEEAVPSTQQGAQSRQRLLGLTASSTAPVPAPGASMSTFSVPASIPTNAEAVVSVLPQGSSAVATGGGGLVNIQIDLHVGLSGGVNG
jgi:hypothetical protein